jgi:dTDP-4-dehydrorhamnose reductase
MARVLMMVMVRCPAIHGLYHVASPAISKYALLLLLNQKLQLNLSVEKDTGVVCDRRLNGSEFNRISGYNPPDWEAMTTELTQDIFLHE